MAKKIASQLFAFQCKHDILDEKDRRLYEYAYNLLFCRVSVYLLIVIVGIWQENLKQSFVFLLAFIALRQYAGGIHLKKEEVCIVASGTMVCMVGQYLKYQPLPSYSTIVIWMVADILIFLLTPIGCSNKKLDPIEHKVYGRRSRIILTVECLMVVYMLYAGCLWLAKGIMVAQIILAMSLLSECMKEKILSCD